MVVIRTPMDVQSPCPALRVGLLVNPVAGLGGPIGRKGSDGMVPGAGTSPAEARMAALFATAGVPPERMTLLPARGMMGADLAQRLPFAVEPLALDPPRGDAGDTVAAAKAMASAGVDLILFAGGDGTARDVLAGVGDALPVLGMPAGVKMHSAVFARSPTSAGTLLARWATCGLPGAQLREVLDRPGDPGAGSAPILYGMLRVPGDGDLVQRAKGMGGAGDAADLAAACARIAREEAGRPLILGPGATMAEVKRRLGLAPSLLGVDLLTPGGAASDVDADAVARVAEMPGARVVLGVIGGQGFLLGRGNQPIGPAAVRRVGREGLRIVASAAKLNGLPGNALLVDTGDAALDRELAGWLPVRVSGRREILMRIEAA
ncbi:ATP-NAD kinase family protein [Sphingomonas baiyangensis]|uniref:ATP-NAD kinase n=1 Tax=Sphingomonas baiyangensis TaxID=2572576 RepID=A0A4U1KZW7_9SPHN|nr:NAD(+)/NADH kinase [Sphingomonas baiyangensis]TKD49977.1 ATP-NAD kinase [Sphingomonas baiyangensis]